MPSKGSYRKKSTHTSKKHRTPKTDKVFTKKVKAVISRTLETKTFGQNLWTNQAITLPNPGVTPSTGYDLSSMFLQNINQGTSDGQRIGDKIHPRSFILTGFVSVIQTGMVFSRPCYLRMVVLKAKENQTLGSQQADLGSSKAFEFATGSVSPTNTLVDITRKMNPQQWTYCTQRIFKLGASSNPGSTLANNDFSLSKFFKINLTKHMKSVIYDSYMVPTTPRNFLICFYGAYEDGTAITFGPYTGPLLNITMDATLKYSDA